MNSRCVAVVVAGLLLAGAIAPGATRQKPTFLFGLDFSADGSLVAACGDRVRVFEVATGKKIREIEGAITRRVAFSPATKELFAAAGDDGIVRLWQTDKPEVVRELRGHDGMVHGLAFDKSGRYLASGSTKHKEGKRANGQFRLWEVATGKAVQSIDVPDAGIEGVSFSPDGKLVAFCRNQSAEPGHVEVFRVEKWERVATVPLPADKAIATIHPRATPLKGGPFGQVARFVADGTKLLIGGGICLPTTPEQAAPYKEACTPTGLLWTADLADPKAAKLLDEPRKGYHHALAVSPDGKRFVAGDELRPALRKDCRVELREAATGNRVWQTSVGMPPPAAFAFSPDGKLVGSAGGGHVRLLNATSGDLVRTIPANE